MLMCRIEQLLRTDIAAASDDNNVFPVSLKRPTCQKKKCLSFSAMAQERKRQRERERKWNPKIGAVKTPRKEIAARQIEAKD